LRAKDFAGTLLRYVASAARGAGRPAPEVAWDFWRQFDQFERLEELRQFRPALYQALPVDPLADDRSPLPETPQFAEPPDNGRRKVASGPPR
jgi:hypothetical protein